jgi:ribose transport system permease protein
VTRLLRRHDEARMAGLIAVLVVVFTIGVSGFFQEITFVNILNRATTTGLLAVGLTFCLVCREIDLSIGASMALAGVVLATLEPHTGLAVACAAGVGAGVVVGIVNLLLVNYVGVVSFVATLGTMLLARGVALVIAHGAPVPSNDFSAALRLAKPLFGPVTIPAIVLIVVAVLGHLLIVDTRYGRELVATGSDPRAATFAGVRVRARRNLAFVMCGACAGVAGVLLALSLGSGSPTVGDGDLLSAAAAAFVSGVALSGGRGSVLAAALAAVALSILAVGLQLWGVPDAYQQVITGGLMVLVGIPFLSAQWPALRAILLAPMPGRQP